MPEEMVAQYTGLPSSPKPGGTLHAEKSLNQAPNVQPSAARQHLTSAKPKTHIGLEDGMRPVRDADSPERAVAKPCPKLLRYRHPCAAHPLLCNTTAAAALAQPSPARMSSSPPRPKALFWFQAAGNPKPAGTCTMAKVPPRDKRTCCLRVEQRNG